MSSNYDVVLPPIGTKPPIQRLVMAVGGGPAPGINGVISAVTFEARDHQIEVYGVQNGFATLEAPKTLEALNQAVAKYGEDDFVNHLHEFPCNIRQLRREDVTRVYDRGGSILGTSRTLPKNMDLLVKIFKTMKFGGMVTIGGDDTAYVASLVHSEFKKLNEPLRVAHVPKTIDNDLPLPNLASTFGFQSARHHGVGIVRNLAEDARTTSRWYIVISMGRKAGHLALGIGKAAAATITIIAEQFGRDADGEPNPISLKRLCDIILGSIIKRRADNRKFGVIVLAEGLIESVQKDLKVILDNTHGRYGNYETDAFGHLRLGEIEFGRLISDLLTERLMAAKNQHRDQRKLHEILEIPTTPYGMKVTFVSKDLGYELRCADPIPFDIEYTRDLGYSAVKFLLSDKALAHGSIIAFDQGAMQPLPFEEMLNPKTGRMQTRLVNVDGERYEVAKGYMIQLEPQDLSDPGRLKALADVINVTPEQFKQEFGYLV